MNKYNKMLNNDVMKRVILENHYYFIIQKMVKK